METGTQYFVIGWESASGRYYSVYSTSNLLSGAWLTNVYHWQSPGGHLYYTNTDEVGRKYFHLGVSTD